MDSGKTLLVDGPASITMLSGEVEILGAQFETDSRLVIREGKRVPFETQTKAEFDLFLSEKASLKEFEGSAIPDSWGNVANTILWHNEKHITVMVLGGIDVGKTSFCAYLANNALKKNRKVALIDADLGQSDVGPPSTIGSCTITRPVEDPFQIGAENVCFIGVTNPSGALFKIVEGITRLKEKALNRGVDVLVINTDGWTEGDAAIECKQALVRQTKPDIVVGIQEQNELDVILNALSETQNITIETPKFARKRDREERKLLRELGYKKYLKGASLKSFHLNWIKILGAPLGAGSTPSKEHSSRIAEILKTTPIHCEETSSSIFLVLSGKQRTKKEAAANLEDVFEKEVRIVIEGEEEGLLVALYGMKENFLGIGVLQELDYERKILKIYTRVKGDVASVHVGQIRLDKTGKELGQSEFFVN